MSQKQNPMECRHAVFVRSQFGGSSDIHFIKEVEHLPDGTLKPGKRILKDFKRPFWVTREGFQNHEKKKEWEDIKRLKRYESTQSQLTRNVARAIGRPGMKGGLRQICDSPYIYGADVTSGSILKNKYHKAFPGVFTPSTVAVLDIETDVLEGTEEPIIVGMSFRDKAVVAVHEHWFGKHVDPDSIIQKKFTELLGEYQEDRNIKLKVIMCQTPSECCAEVIKLAHEWMPDLITCWNMSFDLREIEKCLIRGGYDPAHVFSDPDVPDEFKHYRFVEGPSQKITSSGKVMPLAPAERWHRVECPATFQFVDSMCVYYMLRIALGKEPSYGLDAVLEKNLGVRKLKFKEAEHKTGLAWHKFMQKHYKPEYVIYNIFDCIGVELLDDKSSDLSRTLPIQAGDSLYDYFNKQPRRLVDELHFICLEQGLVMATTPSSMKDEELDNLTLDVDGWIVTLPSIMTAENGVKCVSELPELITFLRLFVAD